MTGLGAATPDPGRRWLILSYAYGVLVALLLGYFLMRIPLQVFDCFTDMMALQERSMAYLVRDAFQLPSYLRPGRWVFQKAVFEVANGEYFYAFRLTQAIQMLVLVLLFVRLVRPMTTAAVAALPLGLAVLIGSHNFAWTLREAYPINHFLTILLCCVAAATLSFSRYRWWNDVLALGLFLGGASTLESGLLVWVVVVTGFVVGLRGVSRWGLAATTACLVGYFYVRFVAFDVGLPGLELRDAGFGFSRYDAEDLVQIFGRTPSLFYVYNVGASLLGVLLGEPRDGVWRLTRSLVAGEIEWFSVVNVVSSVLATALLCRFAWTRRGAWASLTFDRRDQLVLVAVMVLLANAAISYAYTKDVIMSPAGTFMAAAVFVAVVDALESLQTSTRLSAAMMTIALAVLSAGWGVRAVGIHAALDSTSYQVREQWASIDEYTPRWRDQLSPAESALKQRLQDDAVRRHPTKPVLREDWTGLFDTD